MFMQILTLGAVMKAPCFVFLKVELQTLRSSPVKEGPFKKAVLGPTNPEP